MDRKNTMSFSLMPLFHWGKQPYPFFGIEIQILDLSVLEKRREADSIVCQMSLLTNDNDIVVTSFRIELH